MRASLQTSTASRQCRGARTEYARKRPRPGSRPGRRASPAAIREALDHAGSDAQPGEATGPAAEGETVEIAQLQARLAQQLVDHRQDQIRMTALGRVSKRMIDVTVGQEQRGRTAFRRRVDGQQLASAAVPARPRRRDCRAATRLLQTHPSFSCRNVRTSSKSRVRRIGGRLSMKRTAIALASRAVYRRASRRRSQPRHGSSDRRPASAR